DASCDSGSQECSACSGFTRILNPECSESNMKHSAVAVFKTLDEADLTVRTLLEHGFSGEQVSVISRHLEGDRRVHAFSSDTATVAGGLMGGVFGILLGTAFVWLPEFGPLI